MGQLNFTKEEIDEFLVEVEEMLTQAEESFLSLDKGTNFKSCYQNIFRVFHSIKGGSGMFRMVELHRHMHEVENLFQMFKTEASMSADHLTYFLTAIDAAKKIIKGEQIQFDYSLPETVVVAPMTTPQATVQASVVKTKKLGKVFVIDDQETIVEIVKSHLEDHFDVWTFTQPLLALSQLGQHRPDAIITDFNMPEMTGLEVLKKTMEYDQDLPVILLSGVLTKDIILQALGCGIYAAIEKNFSEAQLFTIVESAISRYQLHKLLNKSINLIFYQFPELSNYLKMKGQSEVLKVIETNMNELMSAKRKLKNIKIKPQAA